MASATMASSLRRLMLGGTDMKVDAICKDAHGNEATVIVDLDYVNADDYNEVKTYCENELFEEQRHRFDILDFEVTNYSSFNEIF